MRAPFASGIMSSSSGTTAAQGDAYVPDVVRDRYRRGGAAGTGWRGLRHVRANDRPTSRHADAEQRARSHRETFWARSKTRQHARSGSLLCRAAQARVEIEVTAMVHD